MPAVSTKRPSNPFAALMDENHAREYDRVRPAYPETVLDVILAAPRKSARVVVDVGAGTGQLTRMLGQRDVRTIAIEPAGAMRRVLQQQNWLDASRTQVLDTTGEATGLSSKSADLFVWSQSFHWLDAAQATEEASRVLRAGGAAALVANQLDVEIPWVHRLSRIMRSGDVLKPDRGVDFGPHFQKPVFTQVSWTDEVTPEEIAAIGRTRTSYLALKEPSRARMQENLRWYLLDFLEYQPEVPLKLPYRTFIWTSRLQEPGP